MSKCIGGIAHDAVGSLATHKPSKSFGELFEEKKAQLESLQAGLARAVLPKTPPMPAVKYSDFGIGVDFHKTLLPMMFLFPVPNICMVFDIMGVVFASINTFLPDPPAPPPPPINEDGTEGSAPELSFCQTVAMVALSLIKGMAPTIKVNGHWIGNAGTSIQHLPGIFAHIPLPLVEPSAEGEIFMGSSTVLADSSPFSYQYLPSLSCNLLGIPAPIRPKKMQKLKLSLKAPTVSLAMVIPSGKPVLVGGAPTVDLFAMAMQLGLKCLGKLWKTSGKKLFNKLFGAADDCSKWKKRIRSFLFGEPVDAATGRVYSENEEFSFPGAIPFAFTRRYYSDMDTPSPLGRGWHHNYDVYHSQADRDGIIRLRYTDGRFIKFPALREGQSFFHPVEHLLWRRDARNYVLEDEQGLLYIFEQESSPRKPYCRLSRISNSSGDSISLHYDTVGGHLHSLTDSAGRVFRFWYEDRKHLDRLTRISLNCQEYRQVWQHQYEYDERGLLSRVVDTMGATKTFEYNRDGLLSHLCNQLGANFYWEYEGRGIDARCIHTWGDDGMLEYHTRYEKGKTIATNSLGHTTIYEYDERYLVTKVTDPEGGITHYRYDDFENLVLTIDPLGNSTKYRYDKRGNLISRTDALGKVANFSYDEQGRLLKARSPMGDTFERSFNEVGLVSAVSYPDGGRLSIGYEGSHPISLTDEGGRTTKLVWDKQHNLREIHAPNGGTTYIDYDELGRTQRVQHPDGGNKQYTYDLVGNLLQLIEPNGNTHRFTYNGAGQVLTAEDSSRKVRFEYGGLGDLLARIEDDRRLAFFYDTERQLRTVRNERDEFYRFKRDKNGLVIQEEAFDKQDFFYERNIAGQVVRSITPSRSTEYEYTPIGLLSKVVHQDGTTLKYGYDADGRLNYADNETHQVLLKRGKGGAIIEEIQNGYSIKHQFNISGQRTQMESCFGAKVQHAYDPMGQLLETQAGLGASPTWTAHFEYDVMGRESLRRLLGGVESQTRYDRSGRVTDQVTKGAGYEVSHRSYEWDLSGKLRRLTAGTYTAEFDYDVVGTLAAARYDEVDILYKLPDRIGNIYPDRFGKEATYERGGRRKEDKEWTYHFDGEGFLTQRVSKAESIERYDWIRRKRIIEPLTWTYEWDGAGQLVCVKNNKKVNLRFEYDALGRRVAKINEYGKAEGHKITRFLWDGNVPLHEWSYPLSDRPETIDDSDGRRSYASPEPQTELTTWIFDEGTFVPSAKLVGDRRYSIISDYLGTPVEAYDEEGQRVWARELDIYGRTRSEEGAVGFIPFLYQGQYLDGETGLAYNRFRYYSPETGAYISQDPIRLKAGLTNLYAYVHDVNAWVDPWGLVEVLHFPDFDSARRAAFDIASGGDPSVQFTPTKVDPITGTEVEFKGANGSKIAYDSAHPDMDFTKGHDKPHIGVQTQGKRSDGGSKRFNLTYDGNTHPHRSPKKGEGVIDGH